MKKLVAVCSLCIMLLTACSNQSEFDTEGIKNITVEVLNSDEKSISATSINEEDVASIKEILSAKEQNEEKGFVFAEGMYRVRLEYNDEIVNLYPYCGNASTMRVGDDGATYIELDSEQQGAFEEIIGKYTDIKGGIREWEEYEDN